jgi:hypothetical protein
MSATTAQRLLSLVHIHRRERDSLRAEARKCADGRLDALCPGRKEERLNELRVRAWLANERAWAVLAWAKEEAASDGPSPLTVIFNENAERMRAAP